MDEKELALKHALFGAKNFSFSMKKNYESIKEDLKGKDIDRYVFWSDIYGLVFMFVGFFVLLLLLGYSVILLLFILIPLRLIMRRRLIKFLEKTK